MIRRIGFAVVAIPLLLLLVWLGGWPLAALLAIASVLGTSEVLSLAARAGARPFPGTARVLALTAPLILGWMLGHPEVHQLVDGWWVYAVMLTAIWLMTLAVCTRRPESHPFADIAITLLAAAYTTVPLMVLFFVRHSLWPPRSVPGTAMVFFPFLVVWTCDTAAMLAGRMIGGARLAPTISPGKTRAGAIAGVVAGTVIALLYGLLVFPRVAVAVHPVVAALIGLLLSVVGQLGDLAESLLKREAGVKDSSNLIPGHGGVLDRLDSLYFVLPLTAIAYHLLGLI